MSPLLEAAWEMHQFFTRQKIPYAIIGGIAVQIWSEPRVTKDVDLTVSVPVEETANVIDLIAKKFRPRISDVLAFARRSRVVLIYAGNGSKVDISLALPGYEEILMQRVTLCKIAPRRSVRVCSAEDLIIHKAVAGRKI